MRSVLVFSCCTYILFFNRKAVGTCSTCSSEWVAPAPLKKRMRCFLWPNMAFRRITRCIDMLSFSWCDLCRHIMVGLPTMIDCLCFFFSSHMTTKVHNFSSHTTTKVHNFFFPLTSQLGLVGSRSLDLTTMFGGRSKRGPASMHGC